MDNNKFLEKAKEIVASKYKGENLEIIVVWSSKTLQNNKALLISELLDEYFYEITYNGDKKEFYVDTYKKINNEVIKCEELKK